ncbi:MFS transporter [Sphingomonas sp. MMS24-J13]|uniref:MFS transporter n=1 Tax=Sphingomonas sp. MMS24-J13 TaxID=3238686 RepID=UPI00385036DF
MTLDDAKTRLRDRSITATHIGALALCILIAAIDGFDLLTMALVAPDISKELALGPVALGSLFSWGLGGAFFGTLLLSPLADIYGRRFNIILSILILAAGMLIGGFSSSLAPLAFGRFITGAGFGAMLSSISTLVVEYAPAKARETALGCVVVGGPIGGFLGSLATIPISAHFGWRGVFFFGAIISLLAVPLALAALPESLEFLFRKRSHRLGAINRELARFGIPPIDRPVAPPAKAGVGSGLLAGRVRRAICVMGAVFCFFHIAFYFISNWATKIASELGLSTVAAINVSTALSLGSGVGAVCAGIPVRLWGRRRGVVVALVGFAVMLSAYGLVPPGPYSLFLCAFLIGLCMYASSVILYSIMLTGLPAEVRATATGLTLAIGRIGAVIGPYLGGVLLASGAGKPATCIILALPILVAIALIALFARDAEPA